MISAIKDGRASVVPSGDADVRIPCDTLIVAIGQNIETDHYENAGIPVKRGTIFTLPNGGLSVVKEGIIAGKIGTHGMHDITEGGVLGAEIGRAHV